MLDEEIVVPELLPPSEDGVFKTLLTHPDAKPILRDIISSVLEIHVKDVTVKNVELPISNITQKRERFDVNCTTDSGEQIDVEMQSDAMKGDNTANDHVSIKGRSIFNLCDLHSSQPGRGLRYDDLLRSFQITFCGYTIFAGRKDFINRFDFRNADGEVLSDAVGIVFIELSKLGLALKKPVEKLTSVEIWSIFFSVGDKPEYRELMEQIVSRKEEVKLASHLLEGISHDPSQVAHYLSRRRYQMDMDHDKAVSFDEGKAEGIIEGKAEGIVEGITKGKAEGIAEESAKWQVILADKEAEIARLRTLLNESN